MEPATPAVNAPTRAALPVATALLGNFNLRIKCNYFMAFLASPIFLTQVTYETWHNEILDWIVLFNIDCINEFCSESMFLSE